MGVVYRADDTKLKREVAIKVLPEAFARDKERMKRFEREAQVLASLNHPNIAAIYGLEDVDGIRALVLELVEGPTLAERVAAGPMPLEEILKCARQMAVGLEAAHEKSVIHRDLKPANVKLTKEGDIKILDFGLAKALAGERTEVEDSNSPTLTRAGTQAGVLLGTAAYMSPEQAKGKPVDRCADVWAFGVVLFEMLTGTKLFSGGNDIGDLGVGHQRRARARPIARRDAGAHSLAFAPLFDQGPYRAIARHRRGAHCHRPPEAYSRDECADE